MHTPGPWTVQDAGPNCGNVIRFEVVDPTGGFVCEIEDPNVEGLPDALDNAYLLAAAPELLIALNSYFQFDGTYGNGEPMDATDLKFNRDALRNQARAAIAKATKIPWPASNR